MRTSHLCFISLYLVDFKPLASLNILLKEMVGFVYLGVSTNSNDDTI